jgi:hypothetical protein
MSTILSLKYFDKQLFYTVLNVPVRIVWLAIVPAAEYVEANR